MKVKSFNLNYISFFIAYYTVSLINTFLILYVPVFFLEILNVNRSELALVQFFSYLTLLIGPMMAIFFDKSSKNRYQVLSFSSICLFISFSVFIFNVSNIFLFGAFLSLNFVNSLIIKVGMTKLMMDNSNNENLKKNIILISNFSASIGAILPIIIFNSIMINIKSISLWIFFFTACWFASVPILLLTIFIKRPISNQEFLIIESNNYSEPQIVRKNTSLILLFLANFLIWGDKLIEFPYTSWILAKFGINGLTIYSYTYLVFTYLNILGWAIARKLSTHEHYKLNWIIFITCYSLIICLLGFTDIHGFLFLSALNQIISGIMMFYFTERNVDISRYYKNKTLRYEILRSSYCLASLIYIPLGTLLTGFIPVEALIVIVGAISLASISPLIFI